MKYHILTPFSRFENFDKLLKHLSEFSNIVWHPIATDNQMYDLVSSFDKTKYPWVEPITIGTIPDDWVKTSPGYWKINCAVKLINFDKSSKICFLNDDDFFDKGFFLNIGVCDGAIVIASMKRGHNTVGVGSARHPATTLVAAPWNMRPCAVGIEQLVISASLKHEIALGNTSFADGELILKLFNRYTFNYAPDAYVLFNYLEPGRWNV